MTPAKPITSAAAARFLREFNLRRKLSWEFYIRLSPQKLDHRLENDRTRQWDSPRESLVHQLYVTRNYAYSVKVGVMRWGARREALLVVPAWQWQDKDRLLSELRRIEDELVQVLADEDIESRRVWVPWDENPLPALDVLRGLIDHELLHTGWNLALMRDLGMPVYPSMRESASA